MFYTFVFTALNFIEAYHSVSVNMNNEELETGVQLDLGQFNKSLPVNRYFGGFNYTYLESDEMDKGTIGHIFNTSFLLKNKFSSFNAITMGLGMKIIHIDYGSLNSTAVPLGIEMNFDFPMKSFPLSINTSLYYSPKPLTFGDGDQYIEKRVELAYQIIEMGELFIGYRDIAVDPHSKFTSVNIDISQLPYLGIKIGF